MREKIECKEIWIHDDIYDQIVALDLRTDAERKLNIKIREIETIKRAIISALVIRCPKKFGYQNPFLELYLNLEQHGKRKREREISKKWLTEP